MIKIGLFVDTFNLGGAETVVLQLAKSLLNSNEFQPIVIHFGSQILHDECSTSNIPDIVAPNHSLYKKTIKLPLFAFKFQRFLRQNNIDVLHSHLFGSIVGAAPAAWLARVRHIGTLHDIYTIQDKPSRIWLLKLAVLFGVKLISVSKQMENFYRERGGFSNTSLITIYNGVDSVESSQRIGSNVRSEYHINDNVVLMTCVARLVSLKRHDLLIKAYAELLKNTSTHCKLLLIGDGPERQSLEKLVQELDITKNVLFLGERSDVDSLLSQSDLFVLASDTEGLSCSILEAMANDLPVIATNVGGNSELVFDEMNGYLTPAGDVHKLKEKIKKLIENKKLRLQLGQYSKKLVQEKFQWSETLNKHKKIYEA